MIANIGLPSAQIGECNQFEEQEGRTSKQRTVIITPLRITFINDDSYKISFGCNFWKSCQNTSCSYCLAGMPTEHTPRQ